MTDFSAVVLAGGKSLRMGCDKALLPFGGHRLLEHQLATLRATGATEIFVSAREAEHYSWAGMPIVCDEISDAGPLAGLCATLRRC
ncbi:MAG: NTP transferase domain-containing protein, partial [Chthoniobacterales bacterium]